MGFNLSIFELVNWVSFIFPTLADYLKTVVPLLFCAVSIIGVFSNILPEPGVIYPVPTLEEIKVEFKQTNRTIYLVACLSRQFTVCINRLIRSKLYRMFYTATSLCSRLINHFKGGAGKYKFKKLSDPTPYKPDWKQLTNDADE